MPYIYVPMIYSFEERQARAQKFVPYMWRLYWIYRRAGVKSHRKAWAESKRIFHLWVWGMVDLPFADKKTKTP